MFLVHEMDIIHGDLTGVSSRLKPTFIRVF